MTILLKMTLSLEDLVAKLKQKAYEIICERLLFEGYSLEGLLQYLFVFPGLLW